MTTCGGRAFPAKHLSTGKVRVRLFGPFLPLAEIGSGLQNAGDGLPKCTKSSEMRNGRSCVWIATRPFRLGLVRWVFC